MLERNQIQRLLDIAYLGCQKGHVGLAREVIDGLDQLLENSVELEICRAMAFYTVDQFEPALEVLNAANEKFPENAMIQTHTALVDILMKNTVDAQKKLEAVISKNDDPAATTLAKTLLTEYC